MVDRVAASARTDEEGQWVGEIKKQSRLYVAMFDKVVAIYNNQNNYTAQQLKAEYKKVDDETDEAKNSIYALTDKLIISYDKSNVAAENQLNNSMSQLVLTLLISSIAVVIIGLVLNRSSKCCESSRLWRLRHKLFAMEAIDGSVVELTETASALQRVVQQFKI
ncbi:hypothetical protein GCM10008018_28090 [Paenibacillus marchantiophytorum]|uniref:Methyl-accepting chemotaxis protein n=1 Tax=Paenibacillus marchantiophytorum TaxID=1619310 RepID=A0ABQ1EPA0_9BACL|nr:hypothetical protein [Paenibacillus marchantiophytorum]GFZ80983.1 hypothetical protein GCM10008018_28090 [Paenibacillus marchantiophytorum]